MEEIQSVGLSFGSGKYLFLPWTDEPYDVSSVKDGQALVVLVICNVDVLFEVVEPRIANICAVQKRAEEENGEDG